MQLIHLWVNNVKPCHHYLMGKYGNQTVRFEHAPDNLPFFGCQWLSWSNWGFFHKLRKGEINKIHQKYRESP